MATFVNPYVDQWGSGGDQFPSLYNNAATGENNVPASGGITHNWTNPDRIVSYDDQTANLDTNGGGVYVLPYIRASDFGFDVPTGATIVGIEAEVIWGSSSSSLAESDIRVAWGASAVNLSTANRSTGATLGKSAGDSTVYGGPGDLWGELSSTLTPTVINSSDFGWVFKPSRADTNTTSRIVRIDCMRIRIYYTSSEPLAGAVRTTQTEALVLVTEALPVRVTQVYAETLTGIVIPATVPAGRRQVIVAT